MILTQEQKKARYTIKETKKELLQINTRLNNEIKNLDSYATEKTELRRIRDRNIVTLQIINELELKEVI